MGHAAWMLFLELPSRFALIGGKSLIKSVVIIFRILIYWMIHILHWMRYTYILASIRKGINGRWSSYRYFTEMKDDLKLCNRRMKSFFQKQQVNAALIRLYHSRDTNKRQLWFYSVHVIDFLPEAFRHNLRQIRVDLWVVSQTIAMLRQIQPQRKSPNMLIIYLVSGV